MFTFFEVNKMFVTPFFCGRNGTFRQCAIILVDGQIFIWYSRIHVYKICMHVCRDKKRGQKQVPF